MTVKHDQNGKWSVQVDRKGIPRVRRGGFKSKEAAEQFEREYLAKHLVRCEQHMDMPSIRIQTAGSSITVSSLSGDHLTVQVYCSPMD